MSSIGLIRSKCSLVSHCQIYMCSQPFGASVSRNFNLNRNLMLQLNYFQLRNLNRFQLQSRSYYSNFAVSINSRTHSQLGDIPRRNYSDDAATVAEMQKPENDLNKSKDVLIYEQLSAEFFGKFNLFCLAQFIFFGMAGFSFGGLRDVPVGNGGASDTETDTPAELVEPKTDDPISDETSSTKELPFYRRVNLGEKKIKYGLQYGFMLTGYLILVCGWIYILRSVRYIVLRKDTRFVTIVTYTPFGRNRYFDVAVKDINALSSRQNTAGTILLQLKGFFFRYKVDVKRARFPDPVLFDSTIGRRRNLK